MATGERPYSGRASLGVGAVRWQVRPAGGYGRSYKQDEARQGQGALHGVRRLQQHPAQGSQTEGWTLMHSYPWYPDDWRGSRARALMNLSQQGLYRALLDICFQEGSLSTNEEELRKLVGCEKSEWRKAWPVVRQWFHERDNRLYNNKVDEKRPVVIKAKEDRRKGAEAVNAARRSAHAQRTSSDPPSAALSARPLPSPSPSPSPSTEEYVKVDDDDARETSASSSPKAPIEDAQAAVARVIADPELCWGQKPDLGTCLRICQAVFAVSTDASLDEWEIFVAHLLDTKALRPRRGENPCGALVNLTRDKFADWWRARHVA